MYWVFEKGAPLVLKVVYIDDEVDLCELFADEFSNEQIQISTYWDPQLAIAAINKEPPDVLFIDYRMPATTGTKVAATISVSIPKVLITGDLNIASEYDFEAVLYKPIVPKDVQAILDKYLRQKCTD